MSRESQRRELQALKQAKSWRTRKLVAATLMVAAVALVTYLGLGQRRRRLDPFAKCLASRGVKMYGAYWCPHCAEQKEMFASSFQYVPYIECGLPGSHDQAPACKDAGIKHFPTWQFADGERREGTLPIEALGSKSGCALP
jgi:hypothetical protein